MGKELLSEYVKMMVEKGGAVVPMAKKVSSKSRTVGSIVPVPVPSWVEFSALSRDIVGNALTISSDINEIAAAATVNKGSAVDVSDVMDYARGGSAAQVIAGRFKLVMANAVAAGYGPDEASAYVAGELARGSAMGLAALEDCGGGEAYWTADRGAKLSEFVEEGTEVSSNNPTDFLVVTADGGVIGYSAKSTSGAASNFKNPGLKVLEDLAGLEGGTAGGSRSPAIAGIYAAANKKMERKVPGYTKMSAQEKKEYRDLAKELGLYDAVQSGVRDVFLDAISARLSGARSKKGVGRMAEPFLRSFVPELPNPVYKVVFAKGLDSAVIKPPSASEAIALHIADPKARLSVVAAGGNGITFVSSVGGKLFTYRIKFVEGFGTSLKGAVTA